MPDGVPSDSPPSTMPKIPDHELIRKIGRGGYGEVWLARSTTGAYRAVKVVYRESFTEEAPYEREFRGIKEFEPISRSHPAQVNLLHVGRQDEQGYFYSVMELADDASVPTEASRETTRELPSTATMTPSSTSATAARRIDPETYVPKTLSGELKRRGRLPARECLKIGESLADALEHLHANGLVHRDIKPSNVIFIDGRPKLADIGLVARFDATLSFVGTMGYFPPEGPGKTQADIYSLGKVLYEVSTGRDRGEFPQLPDEAGEFDDRKLFLELNEIVLKACEDSVELRYQSAGELAEDLRAASQGKSVRWRRGVARWVGKWSRRVAVAGLLGLVGFLAFKAYRPDSTSEAFVPPEPVRVGLAVPLADLSPHYHRRYQAISSDGKRIVYLNDGKLFLHEEGFVRPLFEEAQSDWFLLNSVCLGPEDDRVAVMGQRRGEGENLLPEQHILVGRIAESGDEEATRGLQPIPGVAETRLRGFTWRRDGLGLSVQADYPKRWFDVDLTGAVRLWEGVEDLPMLARGMRYSPDGRWICGHDRRDVWLVRPGGREFQRVTSHIHPETHPTWVDNSTLVYVHNLTPEQESSGSRLMVIEIDGESGRPKHEPRPLGSARWSQIVSPHVIAGGDQLMFFERLHLDWVWIATYPEGNRRRQIGRGDFPMLSHDGTEVYYIDRTPGVEGLYARATWEAAPPRVLVRMEGLAGRSVALSPDGASLAFGYLKEGRGAMGRVAAAGGAWETLYHSQRAESLYPRWSPESKFVSVVSDEHLLLLDPGTGEVRRSIELPGHQDSIMPWSQPLWSPSGAYVATVVADEIKGKNENWRVVVYDFEKQAWLTVVENYVETVEWYPDPSIERLDYYGYFEDHYFRTSLLPDLESRPLLPLGDRPGAAWDDFWGSWAPDGKTFFFQNNGNLLVYDPVAGEIREQSLVQGTPFWSGDGQTVGWVERERRWELQLMELR